MKQKQGAFGTFPSLEGLREKQETGKLRTSFLREYGGVGAKGPGELSAL